MTPRKQIIAESYECSKGTIIGDTYKRVIYSLTLKPDIIEVYKVTRKETTLETTFKTLDEFLTWYNELKTEYGHRITRKKLHYIKQTEPGFEYTDYPKAHNCGLRVSNGLIIVPQSITVQHKGSFFASKFTLDVFPDVITVITPNGLLRFYDDKVYWEWYQNLFTTYGKVTRTGIKYYRYIQGTGFQRVTN